MSGSLRCARLGRSILGLSCIALLVAAPTALAADVTAPARILDVTIVKDGDNLRLIWSEVATDVTGQPETVDLYQVYRGTTPDFVPDKTSGSNLLGTSVLAEYVDAGAAVDGAPQYFYRVTAVDTAGNESGSMDAAISTPPVLSGEWTDTTIELNWTDAQPIDDVVSYRVYYGRQSGVYEFFDDVGLSTSHSLTGLELWVNWYAAVVAVDAAGNESAFSNEHIDAVAGRVRVKAHDDDPLCWGAAKCAPTDPDKVQRRDGWQLMVPVDFPEGDWTSVKVTYTMDSKLCEPPAGQNVDRCAPGNPCLTPPCNGGYNTCGDPWDRTALLFLVLDDCVESGGTCVTHGNVELLHTATPFGTDAPLPEGRGIVPPRDLTMDITPLAPLLTGTRYVGAEIGMFVQAGWWVTTEFEFSERPDEASPKPPADGIVPVFFGGATPPTKTVEIPAEATQVFTRYFVSGHGGNRRCDGGSNNGGACSSNAECPGGSCENCDEFCHRENQILVDGNVEFSTVPWRDCCWPRGSLFCEGCRDWNSCGYPSCTFERAGWCPGELACHYNLDEGCDQDLDMTASFPPGDVYDVDYNVPILNGSWSVSLVLYWYE